MLQSHNTNLSAETTTLIPSEINEVLFQISTVFSVPTCLPPIRGKAHTTNLLPRVSAVSVRPYRYPHASKEMMEPMVNDMF